ncbi:MAG: hypothetical protein IAG10_27455 [Planctomycetaceae bacterium]|nr:hypothetical protein [Planctomycetaceae bacterium]
MMYLVLLFVSPVYFLIRGKWLAFLLNAVLYSVACVFLISIIGAFIAPLFWALAVGHAGWHLRKELMLEHANMIANAMAAQMRHAPPTTVA